jgi:ABC-2 type transport system permease protein
MTGLAEIYVQQFKTTLASFAQYRAAIFIWMIGHVLEPLVFMIVWSAVTLSRGGLVGGFGAGDFAAYFLVLMLVNHATYTWIMYEFEYRVRHGDLSFLLLRPLHPIHTDIVDNLSSKMLTLPLILVSAAVLAVVFKPVFHFRLWAAAVFLPALGLAFLVRFLIEWTLALAAFWTTRVGAINQGYYVAVLFLSGQVAPLALLPGPVRAAASVLPFRWMISFPAELLLGRLTPAQAAAGLAIQAGWLVLALLLMKVVWRAGVRRFTAVGG